MSLPVQVGDRVVCHNTAELGCIDRVLPDGHFVVITDDGLTHVEHPYFVKVLEPAGPNERDLRWLQIVKVRW